MSDTAARAVIYAQHLRAGWYRFALLCDLIARMVKRLKRLAVLLVAGFFAFAPPGTLLLAAALLFGLLGKVWLAAAAVGLAALAALWLFVKKRNARRGKRNDV